MEYSVFMYKESYDDGTLKKGTPKLLGVPFQVKLLDFERIRCLELERSTVHLTKTKN